MSVSEKVGNEEKRAKGKCGKKKFYTTTKQATLRFSIAVRTGIKIRNSKNDDASPAFLNNRAPNLR